MTRSRLDRTKPSSNTHLVATRDDREVAPGFNRGRGVLVRGIVAVCGLAGLSFAIAPAGADVPAATGRVDITAETEGLMVEAGAIAASGGTISRANWKPAPEQPRGYTAEFRLFAFAAPEVNLSFRPTQDGEVTLDFRGPWRAEGDKRHLVDWREIRLTGATWASEPSPGQSWHDEPIVGTARVTAGQTVLVTVKARPGGESGELPPALKPVSDPSIAAKLAEPFQQGVNLSNWLEVPPGQSWGDNSVTADELRKIRSHGFDHVRIPVGFQNYAGVRPPYTIDERLLARVETLIDDATEAGLAVLVDVHHYDALTDDDPEREIPRLTAMWRQLATRWQGKPATVAFEILNEPRQKADAPIVNRLTGECVAAIRETNPERAIFVGPANFNAITSLGELVLPDDPRLIVSVHTYAPFPFTHQGASWTEGLRNVSGIVYPGPGPRPAVLAGPVPDYILRDLEPYPTAPTETNPIGPATIRAMLDLAAGYAETTGRPVHLGEFGAYETADRASRLRYYADVTTACRERGIGWAAWDWKAGFHVSDRRTGDLLPGMTEALFGSDR